MALSVKNAIVEIKQRISLVDFFRKRGFDLTQKGTRYWALCPFHNEKTPSFSVNDDTNSYHCFGCGKSGDIFSFLEEKENLSFMEAVESLASELNIEIARADGAQEKAINRKRLLAVVKETANFFYHQYEQLPEDHAAKKEVSKRNISTRNIDNHNLLGWAPANSDLLINHLKSKGFTVDDMVDSGVIRKSDDGRLYCLWRERLTFVISDILNRPIGFSGRKIYGDTKNRKYVNSPDSPVFHKSEVLFCESIAKQQAGKDKEIFVVEGQFDVLAMQHIGKLNTVASSGTAFTPQQANLMKRFVGEAGRIIFCFDADEPGQKAARRAFKNLPSIQGQSYATITKDKDPSDMYRDNPDSLKDQVTHYLPLWKHVLLHLLDTYNLTQDEDRQKFLVDFKDLYNDTSDASVADSLIKLASLHSSIPVNVIESSVNKKHDDDQQVAHTIVDDVELSNGIDALVDNLYAFAIENKSFRPRINEVNINGTSNERFGRWLASHPDTKIFPELFAGTAGEQYIRKLDAITQKLHDLDEFIAVGEPEALFDQQKTIINKEQNRAKLRNLLVRTSDTAGSTDPEVLKDFDEKVRMAADYKD